MARLAHPRQLDERDRRILEELFRNARTPISGAKGIAERVGLANNPCRKRMERLEREGYIHKYTIRISDDRTGFKGFCYLFIGLTSSNKESAREIAHQICKEKNVIMCELITGKYDLLVKIGFRDIKDFNSVHEKITSLPLCNDVETQFFLESMREHHISIDQIE